MVIEGSIAGRGLIAALLRSTISTESLAGKAESGTLASLAVASLAGLSIASLERLTIAVLERKYIAALARLTISALAGCAIATLAESTLDALEAAEAALAALEATAAIAAERALAGLLDRSFCGSTIPTEAALQGAGVSSEAVIAT